MGIVTEKATGNKFEAYYFVKNGLAPLSLKIWNNPEEIDQAIMADKKLRRLSEAELEVARKAMSLGIEYRNHPKAGCKTYMLDQSLLEMYFCIANKEWFASSPVVTEEMLASYKAKMDKSSFEGHEIFFSSTQEASKSAVMMRNDYIFNVNRIAPDHVFEMTVHKGHPYPISEGANSDFGTVKFEVDIFSYETKVFKATLGDILKFWGDQFGCELTPTSGGYKVIKCKIKWPIVQEDLDALKYTLGQKVSKGHSICMESYDPDTGYSWTLDWTPIRDEIEKRIKKYEQDTATGGKWFDKNYSNQYYHWDEIWEGERLGSVYTSVKEGEWELFADMEGCCFQYELGTRIMQTLRFFSAKLESDGSHEKHGVPMFKDCCEELNEKWKVSSDS
jgi:hypothetical protein